MLNKLWCQWLVEYGLRAEEGPQSPEATAFPPYNRIALWDEVGNCSSVLVPCFRMGSGLPLLAEGGSAVCLHLPHVSSALTPF